LCRGSKKEIFVTKKKVAGMSPDKTSLLGRNKHRCGGGREKHEADRRFGLEKNWEERDGTVKISEKKSFAEPQLLFLEIPRRVLPRAHAQRKGGGL